MLPTPALECRDVTYRRAGQSWVRRLSLSADRGELLALCGPAGSGAPTLLRLLAGELTPDLGRISVDGAPGGRVPGVDPRRLAVGRDAALDLLADPGDGSVLLVLLPAAPVGPRSTVDDEVLACGRARAEDGAAVVVATSDLDLVARHADTAALLVAGRLLAWAAPAIAFVPALRILGVGGPPPAPGGARLRPTDVTTIAAAPAP